MTTHLHAFASTKGGVGKSTLAVLLAELLADAGREPVVIDLDFTGTSLADGLHLRAPVVPQRPEGQLTLNAEPLFKWHSVIESQKRRDFRQYRGGKYDEPTWCVFFNDIYFTKEPVRLDSLWWAREDREDIRFYPTSSTGTDLSAGALLTLKHSSRHAIQKRLAEILYQFVREIPTVTDIILDLPPGYFGLAWQVLTLFIRLSRNRPLPRYWPPLREVSWDVHPYLVMTEDRNDLYLSIENYLRLQQEFENPKVVRPLINRMRGSIAGVQQTVRKRYEHIRPKDEHYRSPGFDFDEDALIPISEDNAIHQIFKRGAFEMDWQVRQSYAERFGVKL